MTTSQHRIGIRRPDDWHRHLRDGAMMRAVLPWTVRQFARAIVMPNLVPPIATVAAAKAYRERILEELPAGASFTQLMNCYPGDATDADELARGISDGGSGAGTSQSAPAPPTSWHTE